jgi:hypothetical protein
MFRVILSLILASLPIASTHAGAYKWVDEEGNIHFGDRPPSSGAEEVRLPAPAAPSPAPDAQERRQAQQRMLDIYREDREKKQQAEDARKQQRIEMEGRCHAARDRLRSYKDSILYDLTPEGERRLLSDAERDASIQALEAQIKQHCN